MEYSYRKKGGKNENSSEQNEKGIKSLKK